MALEQTIPASEARARLAELLDQVDKGRIVVTKHGQEKACLISVRELRALEETLDLLENEELMRSLKASLRDVKAGRVKKARAALAELEAEFRGKE